MKNKTKINKIKKELDFILKKYNGELIAFEYFEKIFGNIVLKIKLHSKEFNFVTDRGEIYCNGVMLCNYDYLRYEKKTTPEKLLEIIELVVAQMH